MQDKRTERDYKYEWRLSERWKGIKRDYTPQDILSISGSLTPEYTLAQRGAIELWSKLRKAKSEKQSVRALGTLTGNQAIQLAQAKIDAVYLSGWQVAADNNLSGQMYPDQSLYPSNSVPDVVKSINSALTRADQIEFLEKGYDGLTNYFLPIIADAEAGFGGILNSFELMKQLIEAGAAGVHFEDQLASAKKCGHLGGKVLVPTSEFINKLKAARLAADVLDVPTLIIARTDADSAQLLTSDIDQRDKPFIIPSDRTEEGFYRIIGGLTMAIARAVAYAPYSDLIWCETSKPDLNEAKEFAEGVHKYFPGKMLAYNCSPSFNWKANFDKTGPLDQFQNELAKMGYVFQFVTLAGFHSLNLGMFQLAHDYQNNGMAAYSKLQEQEFEAVKQGFSAVKHQRFVGTSYFDRVQEIISSKSSTKAMDGSTEKTQF